MPRWKLAWILEPATAEQADGTEEGERGFGSKRTDWALYPDAEGKEQSGGQSGPRVEPSHSGHLRDDTGNQKSAAEGVAALCVVLSQAIMSQGVAALCVVLFTGNYEPRGLLLSV